MSVQGGGRGGSTRSQIFGGGTRSQIFRGGYQVSDFQRGVVPGLRFSGVVPGLRFLGGYQVSDFWGGGGYQVSDFRRGYLVSVKGKLFDTRFGLIHVQTGKFFFVKGPPPRIARNCYGYTAGGMPLAFMQEDFLVARNFNFLYLGCKAEAIMSSQWCSFPIINLFLILFDTPFLK